MEEEASDLTYQESLQIFHHIQIQQWPIPTEVMLEYRYGDAAILKILEGLASGEAPEMGIAKC